MTTLSDDRREFASLVAELRGSGIEAHPGVACARYLSLEKSLDAIAYPIRRALLTTPLAWTDHEHREARWLHAAYDDLAGLGYRVAIAAESAGDAREHETAAAALFFMGEAIKWDICAAPEAAHDLTKTHELMRSAMRVGRHRTHVRHCLDGRERDCNVESLYFRALLLARVASGVLNIRQIEILDAWMWTWTAVLQGVPDPAGEPALRADLDSASGLSRGVRVGPGPSLYLRRGPIEQAYRSVVAEFHAGRMVPSEGIASEFRIEEHVAVLELIAASLGESGRAAVPRAERRRVDREVEVKCGLAEIVAHSLLPQAPTAASLALSLIERMREPGGRAGQQEPMSGIYERSQRIVRLNDESDTGLGLEGTASACAGITVGELVAVCVAKGMAPVLGKVVRSAPARSRGRMVLGVRRLGASYRIASVAHERMGREVEEQLLFLPGEDSSGRHDAWLVPDRLFTGRSPFTATLGETRYILRLNRVRDRGRGWVLAGFEVVAAAPAERHAVA